VAYKFGFATIPLEQRLSTYNTGSKTYKSYYVYKFEIEAPKELERRIKNELVIFKSDDDKDEVYIMNFNLLRFIVHTFATNYLRENKIIDTIVLNYALINQLLENYYPDINEINKSIDYTKEEEKINKCLKSIEYTKNNDINEKKENIAPIVNNINNINITIINKPTDNMEEKLAYIINNYVKDGKLSWEDVKTYISSNHYKGCKSQFKKTEWKNKLKDLIRTKYNNVKISWSIMSKKTIKKST